MSSGSAPTEPECFCWLTDFRESYNSLKSSSCNTAGNEPSRGNVWIMEFRDTLNFF
ncbi:uncharacterized protein ASCRUDRAFT_75751, partial [Ascoidea rubescens DSM 1968]